ncbi:MAG: hypothetical protein M3291_05225 [Actinomycetota bacterium]|nr:hypothetical protein [Actinomycetota bacterium]
MIAPPHRSTANGFLPPPTDLTDLDALAHRILAFPARHIDAALKEASMPVLIRDTPLGREIFEQGRQEGRQEGERQAVLRLTVLLLRQRFGADPRVEAVAERLAGLPDEERLGLLAAAADLDDLAR